MFIRHWLRLAVFVGLPCCICAAAGIARADDQPATTAATDSQVDPALSSPRATLLTFFEQSNKSHWAAASNCLDFSGLASPPSPAERERLAFSLKDVLDKMGRVPVDDASAFADGPAFYFPLDKRPPPIAVVKDRVGNWRFSADTVGRIDSLVKEYGHREKVAGLNWLESQFNSLSPELIRTRFLLPNYQWICLLALIFLGFVADAITRFSLHKATATWFKWRKNGEAFSGERSVWRPIGLLAQALTWCTGTLFIGLPPFALKVLLAVVKLFAVVAAVWTSFLLIDVLARYLGRKTKKTDTRFDDLLVPLFSKSMKVFAFVIGILMCAEAFNLPIAGLLGGLGLGGMAVAFASKDAISNLFGSVTVLVDRPFEIGDWIITEGVEGSVESVGFRSTRLRTFYNSQITIPNSLLTTATVDNMGRRRYRRIKAVLGVEYSTTPEQIDAFCEAIRELLRRHPYTRKDYYHVYFNGFGDHALEILLYCFVECPDWNIELREKHRLYLDIVRVAKQLDIGFAFPTRTLHMFQETASQPNLPPGLADDPQQIGRTLAAKTAGPTYSRENRPGNVEFIGPLDVDENST